MTAPPTESGLEGLRSRAEQAILAARPREQVVHLLETLVSRAPEGSQAACFAHRHLAELHLEASPWQAALHLRKVLSLQADDDIAQALMGLCQAVQGNYRSAVAAYRRAVALSPSNPWYNHNLGHLLDVALEAPQEALPYLRKAHRAQPQQEEVGASYAHCLGRVGACDEGAAVARALLLRHPRHADLRALLAWLEEGAPARPQGSRHHRSPALSSVASRGDWGERAPEHDLEVAFTLGFARGGAPEVALLVAEARETWEALVAEGSVRDRLPSPAWLGALEYFLTRQQCRRGRTQRALAVAYGVSVSSLSARIQTLRLRVEGGEDA